VFLAVQALAASGQIDQKPPPKFKLTISEEKGWSANVHWLRVKETNLSHRVIQERWCIPLEYRDGVWIDVVFNGYSLRRYPMPLYAQHHYTLEEQPARCEGRTYRYAAQPGGSFVERIPLSKLFEMSSQGEYRITVTEAIYPTGPTSAAHPYKITTVNSNTLNIYVPRHVPPATTRPGAKHRPFTECLPKGITADSVVKVIGDYSDTVPPAKITVQQKLRKLKAYCTVRHALVDGAGKPITFYQLLGCWGNPPGDYDRILRKQQEQIDVLKQRFDVIEMTCNPSGRIIE
jgi:hypothetical protein